jgi:hypothetical protein
MYNRPVKFCYVPCPYVSCLRSGTVGSKHDTLVVACVFRKQFVLTPFYIISFYGF